MEEELAQLAQRVADKPQSLFHLHTLLPWHRHPRWNEFCRAAYECYQSSRTTLLPINPGYTRVALTVIVVLIVGDRRSASIRVPLDNAFAADGGAASPNCRTSS